MEHNKVYHVTLIVHDIMGRERKSSRAYEMSCRADGSCSWGTDLSALSPYVMIMSQIFSCPAPPTQSISLYYYTALQENTFFYEFFLLLFLLGSKRAESCAGEAVYSWKTFKATLDPCATDELICQVILPSNYDILNPKCRNRKFILCKFITCHTDGAASFRYWCSIN